MTKEERGRRELARISGETGEGISRRLGRFSPDMANLLVEHGYGTVYAAPELSRQFREVATVALLAAGGFISELKIHIEAALRVGIDLTELAALAEHLSLYAGLPRMIEMADILAEFADSRDFPLLGRKLALSDHETRILDTGGEAPPLILLHPVGSSRWAFRPLLSRLAGQVRGIAYDLRGHGSALAPSRTLSIDRWVEDLRELAEALSIPRFHLAGLSLGGRIALAFAERYPERLESLRLLSPPPSDPERFLARARAIRESGPESQIGPTLGRWFTPAFLGANPWEVRICREDLRVIDPEVWATSFEALAALPPEERRQSFPFSVTVLGGECDMSVSPEILRTFANYLEGASFGVVPGAPHQMALESPDALALHLLS
ncbi:MAG: alpha/beta fold hydrolase [Nitrospiraceae bacterium]|nr:alpha/beta fold hydrolase [Nitrospiraceae bacterium]